MTTTNETGMTLTEAKAVIAGMSPEKVRQARAAIDRMLYAGGFKCMECGRKFKTTAAAERASYDGCPKCGSVDVDLA